MILALNIFLRIKHAISGGASNVTIGGVDVTIGGTSVTIG